MKLVIGFRVQDGQGGFIKEMRFIFFAALITAALSFGGCASKVSVSELKTIQDEHGFYTKSLYYTGSTKRFHRFDQFVLFDTGFFIPGVPSDGYNSYKVSRSDLALPRELEFPRRSYEGEDDERRAKIRIKADSRYRVERRKTALERFDEKYPEGIDFSKARVEKDDEGNYVLFLD